MCSCDHRSIGREILSDRTFERGGLSKTIQLDNSMKSLTIESIGNSFMWGFWQSHSQANFVNNQISLEQFPLHSGVVTVFCLSHVRKMFLAMEHSLISITHSKKSTRPDRLAN